MSDVQCANSSRLKRRIRSIGAGHGAAGARLPKRAVGGKPGSPQPDGEQPALLKSRSAKEEAAGSAARNATSASSFVGPGTYLSALCGLISFAGLSAISDNGSKVLLVSLIAAIVPFILLPMHRKRQISGRRQRLERQVPDALDLLVVCTEAGLSLDAAFNRISKELWTTAPELAHELSVTSAELAVLPDRRAAMGNLSTRTESPSLRVLTSALIQTERYGTPIAQALRVLANEMRDQRMLRAEEKAARLPAVMTIPLIVFILPTLFVVIIGPALLQIYDILSRS